jgi:glycerol-3-phosphate responsive antiterminator
MRWNKRVIITFSSNQSNPDRLSLKNQIDQLRCEFKHRHLVHIDLIKGSDEYEKLSRQYLTSENEFTLLLLGKDGEVKLITSRASLVDVFSVIDTMPMRQREMRNDQCF